MKSPTIDKIVAVIGIVMMLVAMILLSACAATQPVIVTRNVPTPDCTAWPYITVADADVLTDETAREIVTNDKNWTRLCGAPKRENR